MNFCVLSGSVASIPILRYFGETMPITKFTLTFFATKPLARGITVVCNGKLAVTAAKYIQFGDHVTIGGRIDQGEILCDDGRWVNKVFLKAWEIRKCHFVLSPLGRVENYLENGLLPEPDK